MTLAYPTRNWYDSKVNVRETLKTKSRLHPEQTKKKSITTKMNDSDTRQHRQPPCAFKTFGVFLFGTLCVSLSQLLLSIKTTNTLRPPTPVEQLQVSKESFRGPSVTAAADDSVPPGLGDFYRQQRFLKRHKVSRRPDLSQRPDYHVVFSTSCSAQQDWESYVFFYHAMKVNQPGNVTRIVSACSAEEQTREQEFFDQYIRPMREDGR